MITGSVFMAYGISAASLLFLNLGVANFPVTHHITLGGSTFAVIAGAYAVSEPTLMVVAALGGLVGALLLGELTQRIAYAHSGTHVDPPAMSIAIYTLVIGVLFLLGVLPNAGYLGLWPWSPTPVLPAKRPSYRSTQLVDGHLPNESMDIKSRISRRRRAAMRLVRSSITGTSRR